MAGSDVPAQNGSEGTRHDRGWTRTAVGRGWVRDRCRMYVDVVGGGESKTTSTLWPELCEEGGGHPLPWGSLGLMGSEVQP